MRDPRGFLLYVRRTTLTLLKQRLPPILNHHKTAWFFFFERCVVGRAIFISYRRDDTEGEAGRLYDDLVRAYGDASVFMDVAGINPGIDFRKAIDDNVATCGVLLAMIGPQWVTIKNSAGQLRLEDANDFVRLEVASALARNIAVIPVLVHDAIMPHPDQLPDNLKDLAYRNSVELTHARWNSDVQLLTKALQQYVAPASASPSEQPVHATVSVQLPPANAPVETPAKEPSKVGLIAGGAIAALLVLGVGAYFAFRSPANPAPSGTVATQAADPQPMTPSSGPGPAPARPRTAATPFLGTWTLPSATGANTLAKLQITGKGDLLAIHAWGDCAGCDWGVQSTTVYGQEATAKWTFAQPMDGEAAGRVTTVALSLDGANLAVTTSSTYADRKPTRRQVDFIRTQ